MAMEYRQAGEACADGLAMSRRLQDESLVIESLICLGNSHLAVQEYNTALRYYRQAFDQAKRCGQAVLAAGTATNISSLYLQLGDVTASQEAAERGLRLLPKDTPNRAGPPLLLQAAAVHARRQDMRTALRFFAEGIQTADRLGDAAAAAFAWDQLGYEWLQRGQMAAAEEAVLEAFRLRKLFRLADLQYSYYTLGLLRSAQGDLLSAARLLGQAHRLASNKPGILPLWRISYQRGRIHLLQGKLESSFRDLEDFLQQVRRIRMEFLTSDSARTGIEAELHDAYSTRIAAAARLYFKTGQSSYAAAAFDAAEANRAVSLMALISTPAGWRQRLPARYWTTLGQLQDCQAELLKNDGAEVRSRLRHLLYELADMESQAGLDLPASALEDPSPVGLICRSLQSDEAFFSFHLGRLESYRWSLTRRGLALHRLPQAGGIRRLVGRFRQAVETSSPEAAALGSELYQELFGNAPAEAVRKPHWLLALDEALFELPFPALVAGRAPGGRPRFLIESHSLRLVPSAAMIRSRNAFSEVYRGHFLALADPVYNRADPRWGPPAPRRQPWFYPPWPGAVLAESLPPAPLQLPRLAGGREEAGRCAAAWQAGGRAAVMLSGRNANGAEFTKALQNRPSVVHLAAHFVKAAEPIPQALLALSLNAAGEPELLGPTEISRWNVPVGLVVLSGCASGQAAALPGAGLMGMTRAWLAAGARAVASSLWPTPDDSGELFVAFYRHLLRLGSHSRPGIEAEALRRAQVEMLLSGAWRADPRYWAAFSMSGKG